MPRGAKRKEGPVARSTIYARLRAEKDPEYHARQLRLMAEYRRRKKAERYAAMEAAERQRSGFCKGCGIFLHGAEELTCGASYCERELQNVV